MIKQNDRACLPVVQKVGCFCRAAAAMAEMRFYRELTARQINDLWNYGQKYGYIGYDNLMKRSDKIATKALEMLGCSGRFVEIATFRNGKFEYYPAVPEWMRDLKKYFIQKISTNGTEGTHFRNVDYTGKVMFDPYSPAVVPKDILYSIVYVYLED